MANGARVFTQLRTPQQLWQAWLRASLLGTTRIWGILMLAGTALLLTPHSPWQWSSAAALFSSALSLSSVAALSSAGVLRRAWAWIITVGGMLFVLLTAMTIGIEEGLNQLVQAPFVVHALMAISWPVLAYALLTGWRQTGSIRAKTARLKKFGWLAALEALARRYTLLEYYRPPQPRGSVNRSTAFAVLGHGLFQCGWVLLAATSGLIASWHSRVGPVHLLGLAFLTMYTGAFLTCKDLHWRHLLAPGTWHRGHLAWHILGASLALQCVCYFLCASAWIALSWAWFDVSPIRNIEFAWKYRILPLEVLAATGLSVLFRSTGRLSPLVFLGAFFSIWGAMTWVYGFTDWPTWFSVDATYAVGLLTATLFAMGVANRLWTVKKLQRFLRLN
jgi:hypothetical protein